MRNQDDAGQFAFVPAHSPACLPGLSKASVSSASGLSFIERGGAFVPCGEPSGTSSQPQSAEGWPQVPPPPTASPAAARATQRRPVSGGRAPGGGAAVPPVRGGGLHDARLPGPRCGEPPLPQAEVVCPVCPVCMCVCVVLCVCVRAHVRTCEIPPELVQFCFKDAKKGPKLQREKQIIPERP